jgi:hypothetical protein
LVSVQGLLQKNVLQLEPAVEPDFGLKKQSLNVQLPLAQAVNPPLLVPALSFPS